jgi:hypothetical protein
MRVRFPLGAPRLTIPQKCGIVLFGGISVFKKLLIRKRFVYDRDLEGTDGLYVCIECGRTFYGSGTALHEPRCPAKETGYENCLYIFGPEVVNHVKDLAKTNGEDYPAYCEKGGFTLKFLKDNFPEVV